jgi:RNA polymerase sigma factor (sigma-70 family)
MNAAEPSLILEVPKPRRARSLPNGGVRLAGGTAMSVHPAEPRVASSGAELSAMIVAIATRADREAFGRLFRHFAPRVKSYLVRSGLSANAAEELAQETLLTVWRKAAYFDPTRAAASTWIFTIARNLSIDLKRRERYGDTYKAETHEDEVDETSGETILMTAEREARVRAALAKLSEEQATIVRLSFFQEKPHSQIAQELGIPLGTAKSRVRLALNRLRALLEDLK